MNPSEMTLDQIRDWFAERQGWKRYGRGWWRDNSVRGGNNYEEHPIPATLGAIAGLMPPGWWWLKEAEDGEPIYWYGFHSQHSYIRVKDTGNELLDRATLAYLAQIEQDRTTKQEDDDGN